MFAVWIGGLFEVVYLRGKGSNNLRLKRQQLFAFLSKLRGMHAFLILIMHVDLILNKIIFYLYLIFILKNTPTYYKKDGVTKKMVGGGG